MKCNTDILISYLDNTLPDEEEREFEEHLKQCEVCRETYNAFKMLEAFEEDEEEIKIDIVSKVMDSIDKEKYLNKKYLFVNKILSNKRNIVKYAMVATLALIFTGGFWYSKETNFFGSGKNIANASKSGNKGAASANKDEKTKGKTATTFLVSKEMVKASNINLIMYDEDENLKEVNTITSKEINKELEDVTIKSARVTLEPFEPTMDLGNPIFKINIEYEKIKQEYYGYNAPTQLQRKCIVLQKTNDSISKNKEYFLLTEDLDVIKNLTRGVLKNQNINNTELPEKYSSEMAKANGDVVRTFAEAFNVDKLESFISNVDNNLNDYVRIVNYTIEGDAIITELSYSWGNITAVVDATRDKFAGTEGRNKKQFAISKVVKAVEGERVVYTAKTASGEDIFLLSVDKK